VGPGEAPAVAAERRPGTAGAPDGAGGGADSGVPADGGQDAEAPGVAPFSVDRAGGGTAGSGPGQRTAGEETATTVAGSVRRLTASDRGVSPNGVKVVFPWFDIASYTQVSGTTTDEPLESGPAAIQAYVDHVNANGGIDGRKLDAQIEDFNPLNEPDMRARCRRWTEDDKVFAVVDSQAWHSDHQLCITQDHDTPLVTSLGLSEGWARKGAPYLWYTAPTSEETIEDWIVWAVQSGRVTQKSRIGVVTGVREEEKLGRAAIEAGLRRANLLDQTSFEEIPGYTSDIALANAAMPGAVSRLKAKGVDKLFMGLTSLAFTSWMQHADSQEFFPDYLLSDFNNTITVAEALLASDHPRSLKGAAGPTYIRLGEKGADAGGVYSPQEKLCNDIWQKANPKASKLDRAGVAMRWCDNILLFAEAARRASRASNGALTRKNFATAMATVQGFAAGMTVELSYTPGDYAGPTQTRVVEVVTENESFCTSQGDSDDNCHRTLEGYRPMRRF
jgi:ABC-type branched-subunit amino acid transport system substrate-binding protein